MRKLIVSILLACVFGHNQAKAQEIQTLTVVSKSEINGQAVDGLFKSVYSDRRSSVVDIEVICDGMVMVVRVPLVPLTRGFVIVSNLSVGDRVVSTSVVSF